MYNAVAKFDTLTLRSHESLSQWLQQEHTVAFVRLVLLPRH